MSTHPLSLLTRTLEQSSRRPVQNVTALDEAWEKINALGGTVGEYDDFGRGINHAVEQALFIIEELGGSDPLPKRAEQSNRRIPVSGATAEDVEAVTQRLATLFDFFGSAVESELRRLNENLPVTNTFNVRNFLNGLADMKFDVVGELNNIGENLS